MRAAKQTDGRSIGSMDLVCLRGAIYILQSMGITSVRFVGTPRSQLREATLPIAQKRAFAHMVVS